VRPEYAKVEAQETHVPPKSEMRGIIAEERKGALISNDGDPPSL